MEVKIKENKEKKRFEAEVENKLALIEYIRAEDKMYLTHTEVPSELEGKGIASSMAKQVLQQIKDENLKLVPLCPFIASYVKRHPEWKEILAEGYKV
ncbi:acetyltransferase [Aequorivita soesokkakensis]|jgi:predicted GNAT family acetyltransferase|uniref:Acetyltransferase n=1 Tax=Aequorivita soesokkakensis TaxID=1385699 RepID=A0A1A9LFS4_9FLAO|nr:GNAT family N-acetyltransferase [Aequorivita soesokkakensis]OAD92219.1 acetyltransferase [Aequorivita soesokkakensis]